MARTKIQPTHTRASITQLLLENDQAVARALVVLFDRQTNDEKLAARTKLYNMRGFTGADAHYGTRNARQVLGGRGLYDSQLSYWRRPNRKNIPRIAKYWRQLVEEAELKAQRKAEAQRIAA